MTNFMMLSGFSLALSAVSMSGVIGQENISMDDNRLNAGNPSDNDGAIDPGGGSASGNFSEATLAGCKGKRVISWYQGTRNDGTPVLPERSDVSQVLGDPDMTNTPGGFFSLGFGGWIIIETDGSITNVPGNDITIFETSYGQPACAAYREQADISVSQDLVTWQYVGTICQDGSIEISPLPFIRYVRIQDVSLGSDFTSVVDGFDVDGIKCTSTTVPDEYIQDSHSTIRTGNFETYPNPIIESMTVLFRETHENGLITVTLSDPSGRILKTEVIRTDGNSNALLLDTSELHSGIYFVQTSGVGSNKVQRIIKQ